MFKKGFLTLTGLLMCSNSYAAAICTGKVTEVALHHSGELRIVTDFRSTYFAICNVNGTWNNIETTTCMAWFSQVELAYKNNIDIRIHYANGTDCNTFPAYADAPKPDYIINYKAQ
jgi:hypothetical protein